MTERREFPAWLEYLLLVAVFGLAASWLPPDPNEAHYLCKSRHYWEPEWCGRDFFLASSDSHACFYLLFGWIARLMPLLEAAWCGRVLTWLAMAWGWQRLSFAVLERRGWSILAAAAFVMLNERFHQWCLPPWPRPRSRAGIAPGFSAARQLVSMFWSVAGRSSPCYWPG
jgi:hypothetical protein